MPLATRHRFESDSKSIFKIFARGILRAFVLLCACLLAQSTTHSADAQPSLKAAFKNPPLDSRPMVRWWWFGVAAEKTEILHELQQMKADNIGGVELAFVYPVVVDNPAKGLKNLPFLSPQMLDCVRYAQSEARRLGLRVDVTLGSGWPYGGPSTTLAQAAWRLRFVEEPVPANSSAITAPKLGEGESFISAALVKARDRQAERPAQAWSAPQVDWDPASAAPLDPLAASLSASPNARVALYFIAGHTGQVVKRAAAGAEGWVLDPFSHEAVATHLKSVGEPLVAAFGATPPYAVFSDSLEAYGADWTPDLPAEFIKRRGYDLRPHLPELVAGDGERAKTIRHDWGRTLTELVDENYLAQINRWARAHHTRFRSQTYGEPAVSFSSQRLAALIEGENAHWREFSTLRWAASANHVFGNTITSGESFTWLHSPVFRATPLDMKAEADIDFISGENQFIFHGWPYSAPQVPEPGWSLYAAAALNDHNPWHPVMPDVARYIQRAGFLLRQGQPANQVLLLLPTDDAWANFAPGHVAIDEQMERLVAPALISTILSAGYNIDFIDADAIDSAGFGTHSVLVLPPTDRIPAATLRKIGGWVDGGGKVISVGRAPSIDPEGRADSEISGLSRRLFSLNNRTFVANESGLTEALHRAAEPDLRLTEDGEEIGFIRRKLPGTDVYFVANTSNHSVATRVSFATKFACGERWNPDTAESIAFAATNADLKLAPYESAIFVFSRTPATHAQPCNEAPARAETTVLDLSSNWQVRFAGTDRVEPQAALTDWAAHAETRYYSGEAIYSREFTLAEPLAAPVYIEFGGGAAVPIPRFSSQAQPLLLNGTPDPNYTPPGPGIRAWFDPPIREAAVIFLNGRRAGSLWHPPYRLDLAPYLRRGQNRIDIHVYNTAINAWAAQPPYHNAPLIARYGDRFQMQDMDKVEPQSSGLIGTVRLVSVSH